MVCTSYCGFSDRLRGRAYNRPIVEAESRRDRTEEVRVL